jgi:hypothetical protein
MKGPDVAAVGAELKRLGYVASTSDTWDSSKSSAVRQFWKDRGGDASQSMLLLGQLLLLNEKSDMITKCDVNARTRVNMGDELIQAGGGLTGLQAVATDTLASGDHVVTYNEVSAPLSAEGAVTDAAFLAAVGDGPEFKFWQTADENNRPQGLNLTVTLPQAVTGYTIPPSALYDTTGTQSCVLSGSHEPIAVDVISSSMGNSTVTAETPFTSVLIGEKNPPSCK